MSNEELIHYGVKGMKWGVRRAEKKAATAVLDKPNANYTRGQRNYDRKNYGNGGAKRINRRLNQGQDLKTARKNEQKLRNRRSNAIAVAGLAAYYGPRIYQIGKVVGPMAMGVAAQKIAVRAETKRGQAAAANAMGLPRQGSSGVNYSKKNRNNVYNISSL